MSGVVHSDTKSLPENVAKSSMSLMETGNNAGPGIVRSLNFYLHMKITISFNLVILESFFVTRQTTYDFTVSKGTRGLVPTKLRISFFHS